MLVLEIENLPIRLSAQGQWRHGDVPLHPKVADLFARCVVPDAEGGYHLEVGDERAPIEVVDTAFFVRSMQLDRDPPRVVDLVISDGRTERLDPSTLTSSAEHVFYCRVQRHGVSVPCRFPPSLYHRLALHVEEDGDGFALVLGRDRHHIGVHPA